MSAGRLGSLVLAAALAVAAAASSCTFAPTVEEACDVLCDCALPSEQAACESQCPGIFAGLPEACLQCIVDVEECSELEPTCQAICQGPMP